VRLRFYLCWHYRARQNIKYTLGFPLGPKKLHIQLWRGFSSLFHIHIFISTFLFTYSCSLFVNMYTPANINWINNNLWDTIKRIKPSMLTPSAFTLVIQTELTYNVDDGSTEHLRKQTLLLSPLKELCHPYFDN